MGFRKKKRGNAILDVTILIVILFIISVSYVIVGKIQSDLNTDIQADDSLTADAKQVNQQMTDRYPKIFDAAVVFFLILFWALTLVASFMIDTHPVFFIFSLILLILVFIVVISLGNMYIDIFTDDLAGLSGDYPKIFWIWNSILPISIVIGFSILIAMFARPK